MSSDAGIAGLCATCRHSRVIQSARGSRFWNCGLHDSDARFPKYPRLPVVRCDGYEIAEVSSEPPE
jgi:hypothetical protein